MSDLRQRLDEVRDRAKTGGLPTRRKDTELYGILVDCLEICQMVEREGIRAELVQAITGRPRQGRNRIYVYSTSDNHILVCRYVLEGEDNRNSIYRYAAALREASARQISAAGLMDWLKENGGINTLFKSRPVHKRDFQTSTLHLNSKISAPKDAVISLRIRRDERGFFDVLQCEVRP